jgi:hypothetical protein
VLKATLEPAIALPNTLGERSPIRRIHRCKWVSSDHPRRKTASERNATSSLDCPPALVGSSIQEADIHMNNIRKQLQLTSAIRWLARAWSLITVILVLAFIIGEGFPGTLAEWLGFLFGLCWYRSRKVVSPAA